MTEILHIVLHIFVYFNFTGNLTKKRDRDNILYKGEGKWALLTTMNQVKNVIDVVVK
jgi:hypothetical protein